jgi:hypothetical protein
MIISELFEAPQQCPECGGISFSDLILAEKKDACYHKVKASAKVWPSAYASGRLVQCRKKGAANYGNKSEGVAEGKEDKIAQLKKDHETAVYWSKNDTNPHKREAARQKAEKIKRHLETQYKQGVAEAEKNPHTSALGRALYRDLSKEKKASPQQVQRNKERWAKRQADKEQGMAEGMWDRLTTIPELERAIENLIMGYKGGINLTDKGRAQLLLSINKGKRILAKKKQQQDMAEGRMVKGPGGVPLDRQGRPIVAKAKPLGMRKWLVIHDGSHGEGGKDIIEAPNAETAWELANEYDLYIIDIKPYRGPAGPTLVDESVLDEAVGMMIKGAAISGPDDQDIADRIAARTGGRVDSGSRGHHILIIYPTLQDRARAAAKIRKMFPGIELYKSGGNRNAIDEQGVAEGMKSQDLAMYCEKLVAEKGWDAAYKHALMMANVGRDPVWNGVLKYLDAMKDGVAEAKDKFSTSRQDQDFRDQADYGGEDPDARDRYGNLKRSTNPGLGGTIDIGGVDIPAGAFDAGLGSAAAIGSLGGLKGMSGNPRDLGTTSRDIATQRSVGGKEIPSLGQAGKVVTSPSADRALTKVGGKNASTTSGPAVTVQKRGSEYEPLAADVPAYVRKGLPDPVTTPVGKPKITVRPGETQSQAMQRTRAEQEFSRFLKGQGGQSFGTPGAGRGGQGGPTAAQTSGSGQVPTIKLPSGQTIPDPARLSPSGQYNTQSKPNSEMDKIMQKWDKEQQAAPSSSSSSSKSKTSPSKFLQLFGPDKMDEESRKKREKPEVDYDDEYDAMVARVKKLAGLGPMKTVYDPARRQYRNMPTAVQPKK